MKSKTVLVAFSALMFLAGTCFGQAVKGTLLGTITDSSGATVPNAKVTINDASTGFARSTQTNESGNYIFPDLPPGTYTVAVEIAGFKRSSRSEVVVQINSSPRIDLILQPGNVSESIEVSCGATAASNGPVGHRAPD